MLVQGFGIYRREGGKGRLTLIGTGPGRQRLADMVEAEGVGAAAQVHGPRFGDEKMAALREFDFFVQSSRFDGLPIACLEAALTGLPLIVSIETGLAPPVAQFGAGLPLSALTATAVAKAMKRAETLTMQDWRRMADGAYRMALSIGDWTAVARRLRTLYATSLAR